VTTYIDAFRALGILGVAWISDDASDEERVQAHQAAEENGHVLVSVSPELRERIASRENDPQGEK
jgi:hypothetical protein